MRRFHLIACSSLLAAACSTPTATAPTARADLVPLKNDAFFDAVSGRQFRCVNPGDAGDWFTLTFEPYKGAGAIGFSDTPNAQPTDRSFKYEYTMSPEGDPLSSGGNVRYYYRYGASGVSFAHSPGVIINDCAPK
ncbi:hypothetical protein G5B40_20105 [Pikeienuella piscinae]|uniref:Lipoprotein n=1 Tax=Pikeienuella piscinae TaxID=2748098 RepID=A0A7M3T6B7_9RHOB|nr:hypothetical protein [Pikeienuella piscinae]QIE57548.1 hypothetical protein G5B40_20105 [Pikeienuella piscinae]